MNTEKYIYLIYQHTLGTLSSQEKDELTSWLKQSPENEKLRDDILASLDLMEDYQPNFSVDTKEDYAKMRTQMDFSETVQPQQQKSKTIAISSRRRWLGIAAAFLLLAVASFFFLKNQSPDLEWMTLKTIAGEKQNITLADGSKIWLNENSQLSYPKEFLDNERLVKLKGEAFFDIEKNPSKVFQINTSESTVQVLGTSFNVRAYQTESSTTVTVKSGKVKFSENNNDNNFILTKNQEAILNHTSSNFNLNENANLNAIAWQTNKLSFRNEALSDVFKTLEKHFDIEIDCKNETLKKCTYSLTPQKIDLETLFEDLKKFYKLEIKKEGTKKYIISGGGC